MLTDANLNSRAYTQSHSLGVSTVVEVMMSALLIDCLVDSYNTMVVPPLIAWTVVHQCKCMYLQLHIPTNDEHFSLFLWPPYVIGGHYIFAL